MIFKVAVLQMRSENRAVEENSKTIIKYMTEGKKNDFQGCCASSAFNKSGV